MQAVILCGGFGTRIRDVADDIPKPMIPIGEMPILWHIMKGYARFGVRDFVLCLGQRSFTIKRWFRDYHMAKSDYTIDLSRPDEAQYHGDEDIEDWRITFAETGLNSMTGARVKRIEQYIAGDTFMVTYGDGVADVDINDLLKFHHSHGRLATLTSVRQPGRFGELDLVGDRVADFSEKPLVASGWINGGFFVFDRAVFDRLDSSPGLILEREPLKQLAADGELMAYRHDGFWHPMDSSRDYKHLNDLYDNCDAPWMTWDAQLQPERQAA